MEFDLETEYFENKYKATFDGFNQHFTSMDSDFDKESDWLSWEFAVENPEVMNLEKVILFISNQLN